VNDSPQTTSFALFVREALDLPVPPSPDTPPRRNAGKAHREVDLSASERQEAGEQWLAWWRRLVDVDFRTHAPMPTEGDIPALIRARVTERETVFDPPAFSALSDSPALQTAVVAAFEDFRQSNSSDKRVHTRGQRGFDATLPRDVAEALIAELNISPDRLDASVLTIDVPGHWSHIPGPGTAICSLDLATDPEAAKRLLRAVFASGLER
jgi:hypothetical protein